MSIFDIQRIRESVWAVSYTFACWEIVGTEGVSHTGFPGILLQGGQLMSVAVISRTGERLMPTSEYRARRLLKSGKAIKYCYNPFTIKLTERETGNVQPIELCVDTGYVHIGMSVKSEKHEYLAEQIDTLTDEKNRHDAYQRCFCNGSVSSETSCEGDTLQEETSKQSVS